MRQLKPAFRVSQVKFSGSSSGDSGSEYCKSQVPGTQVWGPGCLSPSSRILGFRVPCLTVPESQGSGSQGLESQCPKVQGLRVPGSRVSGSQGPGSRAGVLILDYAKIFWTLLFLEIFYLFLILFPKVWSFSR